MEQHRTIAVRLRLQGNCEVEGDWQPDERQMLAAWEMYVELVTRVATIELEEREGLLREALLSLHELFGETRSILRKYGPDVARPLVPGSLTFGYLAVAVLNLVLRPILSKWHPALLDHESRRHGAVTPTEHERTWEGEQQLREELASIRAVLIDYSEVLAAAAGVPPLIANGGRL